MLSKIRNSDLKIHTTVQGKISIQRTKILTKNPKSVTEDKTHQNVQSESAFRIQRISEVANKKLMTNYQSSIGSKSLKRYRKWSQT